MARITLIRRLRQMPFSKGVEAAGVKDYTVHNQILLPTFFDNVEADYYYLKHHVQVWNAIGPNVGMGHSTRWDMAAGR